MGARNLIEVQSFRVALARLERELERTSDPHRVAEIYREVVELREEFDRFSEEEMVQ